MLLCIAPPAFVCVFNGPLVLVCGESVLRGRLGSISDCARLFVSLQCQDECLVHIGVASMCVGTWYANLFHVLQKAVVIVFTPQ